ncbi:hypothetical protein FB451DRAFT_694011 [Mycena latifolia]|nr:hypothetical protein FB451DRAFT_694011 [Mycena latifolia]
MALMLSPPPEISSLQEPEPSSDEDLVPNDPATFESPQPRKRKRTKQTATPSKRPKVTTEKTVPSPSRQPNAVAGPSKPRVPHRRSKSPSTRVPASSNGVAPRRSQASSNGQVKKASVSHPRTQSAASASTKPVRRTVKEKRRQRDSDSDSDPSTFKSQANNGAPSVSAPVPKRRDSQAFQRTALAKRFTTKSESAPVRPRKSKFLYCLL